MNVPLLASIIDPKVIGELMLGAAVAGIGTTTAFAFAILGTARSHVARQEGRGVAAAGWLTLAGVMLVAFAAGVVFGILTITNK